MLILTDYDVILGDWRNHAVDGYSYGDGINYGLGSFLSVGEGMGVGQQPLGYIFNKLYFGGGYGDSQNSILERKGEGSGMAKWASIML